MTDPACAAVSLAQGEPLQATASQVRNWVLVEHPGAWGPAALTQSGLPRRVAEGLAARGREHGFRVLLLRRPERPAGPARQCFVAHSGRGSRWIEERVVDGVEELLDVDFAPLREGLPVGFGPRRRGPLYLVCTNGRHDPCCANLGRPVARALHAWAGETVWESSHYGGDRFAGNLVCLPEGLYFGRLSPAGAVAAARAYEQGVIDLDHYRGRAGEPFPVQAGESFLRRAEGLLGVNDVVATTFRQLGGGVVEVGFRVVGDRSFAVRVAVGTASVARPLSCRAAAEENPQTYALVAVNAR